MSFVRIAEPCPTRINKKGVSRMEVRKKKQEVLVVRKKNMTVKRAKKRLYRHLKEGKRRTCPVCSQNCKIYARPLNSGMAASLCWIVKKGGWVRIWKEAPKYVMSTGGEYAKLEKWGLIERNNEKDKQNEWKATQKGIDFVERRIQIPSHVLLYNNKIQGYSDKLISIDDALKDHFDYHKLMQNYKSSV
jgi:hypothetical protein